MGARLGAMALCGVCFVLYAAAPAYGDTGYVTIFADRAQLVDINPKTCQPRPNTVPLTTVMSTLAARGLQMTFGVVTGFINESTNQCRNPALYPSWDQLMAWHSAYGFEATSNGQTKLKLAGASDAQIRAESCGSLPLFTNHGFDRAWGLFSYPADLWTIHTQSIVDQCFAYGRDYNNKVNVRPIPPPYFAYVKSARGGDCAIGSSSCNGPDSLKYFPPSTLLAMPDFANPSAGRWRVIQFYRFVDGYQSGLWDCTNSNDRYHWTYSVEDYCWNDFLTILDAIRPTTETTDPATVADDWGRGNPGA